MRRLHLDTHDAGIRVTRVVDSFPLLCGTLTISTTGAGEVSGQLPGVSGQSPIVSLPRGQARNEVVEIEDASVEDVRQLVCYMYTGMIEDDYTRFRELLVLADQYQVHELVYDCDGESERVICFGARHH